MDQRLRTKNPENINVHASHAAESSFQLFGAPAQQQRILLDRVLGYVEVDHVVQEAGQLGLAAVHHEVVEF
jgi:hypothetical protein